MARFRPLHSFALLATFALIAQTFANEPLPTDPRIKTGTLPNGLKWMYLQHNNPPGKMAVWIHVQTGSLNENEDQRGLAHFLEHMSFNGTENFAPGELLPYFEAIGMSFGPDVNAHTTFDHTAYKLYLPDTSVEQFDKGLMVLSDYAFRMLLLPEEIDKERGVILSELRAGMGPEQRIRDMFFEQVFAGTRISQRLVIGTEEVISNAPRPTFESYYRTWYRPENMTLMMVGDAPLEQYLPSIEKWFGTYHADGDVPPQQRAGFVPFTEPRAFVFSDPEYTDGDVDVYNVSAAEPPITTVEQARAELVKRIGAWIVNRRYSERIKQGEATYRSARAGISSFLNDATMASASATGKPADWEKMLDELVLELNRAREYGFLAPELDLAKTDLLSSAERAVETESTRNARSIINQMNRSVSDGEPMLSAQQQLDLFKNLLPTVTLAEVNTVFAEHFKPGTFAYVLTLPESDDVTLPTTGEVLAAAKAAEARQADAPTWVDRPTDLLAAEPTPGKVVESTTDEQLGITSAWLSNGVRVHHRYMDYKKDTVYLGITLAGGQIQETADNAGITMVASLTFSQPATSRLKSTDVEDIMTGKNIQVAGGAQDDAVMIEVFGSINDLESGLQLAHALLTDGRLEQSIFDNWKQGALQRYEMATKLPRYVAIDTFLKTLSGNDPRRMMLMPPDIIEQQSVARSQAWLDRLFREAPIEVAVVGDITLDAALPLVEKYVGSLPNRPRTPDYLDQLRTFNRGPGPYSKELEVETTTPQAMALAGFIGCDAQSTAELRALNVAAKILDSRLIKRVREELGLVYSIGAQNMPGAAYKDAGFFLSGAPCEPGKGPEVVKEIHTLFADFATNGPTAEELENAKKQIANDLDTELKEPSFWYGQLQTLELHKMKLADLHNIEQAYADLTAEGIQAVFAKYYTAPRLFDIVSTPKLGAPQPTEEEAAPANP